MNIVFMMDMASMLSLDELIKFMRATPEHIDLWTQNVIWRPILDKYILTTKKEKENINKENIYVFITQNWNDQFKKYKYNNQISILTRNKQIRLINNNNRDRYRLDTQIPSDRPIKNMFASHHNLVVLVQNPNGVFINKTRQDGDPVFNINCPIILGEVYELQGIVVKKVHFSFDSVILLTDSGLYMFNNSYNSDIFGEVQIEGQPIIDLQLGNRSQWAHPTQHDDITIGPFNPWDKNFRIQYPQYKIYTSLSPNEQKHRGYIGVFNNNPDGDHILILPPEQLAVLDDKYPFIYPDI